MVVGIEKFRQHFAGHEDEYVLIGGAACDLLFTTAGLEFRATKDLDIVLCVEVVSQDFAKAFLAFVEAGGYEARQQQGGRKEFCPFKAKAFLDLTERRMRGEEVDRKTITKHRNDVFRLLQLLPEESRIDLAEPIRQNLRAFLDLVAQDDTFDPRSFRVQLAPDEGIGLLTQVYALR